MEQIPQLENESSLTSYFKNLTKAMKSTLKEEAFKSWLANVGIGSRITYKHALAGRRKVNAPKLKAALDLGFQEAAAFDVKASAAEPSVTAQTLTANATYAVPAEFFETPLNTIALNLCGLKESFTRENIHQLIGAAFAAKAIDASLDRLLEMGLVTQTASGALRRVFEGALTTLPGVKSDASKKYFEATNQLATHAWNIPLELRELHSFTLRLDHRDLPRLKDLVREFRKDAVALSEPSERDSVYQCSVSVFPIYLGR